MLAVNDLFYLASPLVTNLFFEDVTQWLNAANIRYVSSARFVGKSGYDYMFDFTIPSSSKQPERFVQVINNPKKDTAEMLIFRWEDVRENRSPETILYPILNDTEFVVPTSMINAMENYGMKPTPWSQRSRVVAPLAA